MEISGEDNLFRVYVLSEDFLFALTAEPARNNTALTVFILLLFIFVDVVKELAINQADTTLFVLRAQCSLSLLAELTGAAHEQSLLLSASGVISELIAFQDADQLAGIFILHAELSFM